MNVKDRPRLGRGLKSLISHPVGVSSPLKHSSTGPTDGDRFAEIDLALIDPNPHQPRSAIDPKTLKELAASIKSSGILQPVILKPVEGRFQLSPATVAPRPRASRAWPKFPPCCVMIPTEAQQAEWALIEKHPAPGSKTPSSAPRPTVPMWIPFISRTPKRQNAWEKIGDDIQLLAAAGLKCGCSGLSGPRSAVRRARQGARWHHRGPRQDALANRAVAEGLSVRKLEELIAAPPAEITGQETSTTVSAHTRTMTAKSPHVIELEQELSRKLGTRLRIFPSKRKNTGRSSSNTSPSTNSTGLWKNSSSN